MNNKIKFYFPNSLIVVNTPMVPTIGSTVMDYDHVEHVVTNLRYDLFDALDPVITCSIFLSIKE